MIKFTEPSFSLEDLRKACIYETLLFADSIFVKGLEQSLGVKYHGHTVVDFGAVTLYFSDSRSCSTRTVKTLKLDKLFADLSVSAALLDLDEYGNPITLDIHPLLVKL
jgi:hypothetical protein